MQAESSQEQRPDILTLTQAKLLNCVGMIYSGDEHLMTAAKSYHGDLASFCDAQWSQSISSTDVEFRDAAYPLTQKWEVWCEVESRRRTGYSIWVRSDRGFFFLFLNAASSIILLSLFASDAF
jgi:hypothetical protein